jgi:carnitine-CoA ligase
MTAVDFPPLDERTVPHVLERGARRQPGLCAVADPDESLTYAELLAASRRVAGGFAALGVGRQEPVLLMLDNSVDHALAWFGLSCLAAVEVPVNTAVRGPQLTHVVNDSGARLIVIEHRYLDLLMSIVDTCPNLAHVVVRGGPTELPLPSSTFAELRAAAPAAPVEVHPWDLLGVLYTSGTTGRAKGVQVTQAQTYGRMWPGGPGSPEPGDVTLVTLPIYHVIGQVRGLYNSLISDGTAVLLPRFSASAFWSDCRRYGATYAPLVGAMGTFLMRQPPSELDTTHGVRRICVGTTFPEVEEFRARFGVEVHSSYGLTEAGGVLIGRAEPTGCGWARPDFTAQLVDEHDVPVARGAVGELVLRPTEPWTVMAGYHNRPDATVAKWRNLWLHTGDLMRQRADGQYVFVDRMADTIRRLGENVSSFEVESETLAHPDVAECAVVPIDVPGGEPEIKVVVVLRTELAPADLVEWLAGRLPRYAVPRYVEVLSELPRTPSTQRVTKAELVRRGVAGAWDRMSEVEGQ